MAAKCQSMTSSVYRGGRVLFDVTLDGDLVPAGGFEDAMTVDEREGAMVELESTLE